MTSDRYHGSGVLRRLRLARRRLATGVAGLFGVVWLGMAVQPCLMAAEPMLPAPHHHSGCPHCPPVDRHCGDPDSGRCTYIDAIDYDGRQVSIPAVTDFSVAMAPPVPMPAFPAPGRGQGGGVPDRSPPPPTGPPLFVRNCSFLK